MKIDLVPFNLLRAEETLYFLVYEDGTLCRIVMHVYRRSTNQYTVCELYTLN